MLATPSHATASASKLNPREELVALLRGAFACPAISFLGRRGYVERILSTGWALSPTEDHGPLGDLARYLAGIGILVEERAGHFIASELGAKVLSRFGAFCIIDSYEPYFRDLDWMLAGDGHPQVDRARNVIGSGQLHVRKFFPPVLDWIRRNAIDRIVDLGCGDGTFLTETLAIRPELHATGVDLSPVSTGMTAERLSTASDLRTVTCSAFAVDTWAATANRTSGRCLITMWFLLHEIHTGEVDRLVAFFEGIAARFPGASLAFAELIRHRPADFAEGRLSSIMPEYVLFHAISGQRILTPTEFAELFARIPYRVQARFDQDQLATPGALPCSTVCILEPR